MNGDTQEGRSAERAAVTGDGSVVLLHEDGTWRRPTPRGAVLPMWRSLYVPSSVIEVFRGLLGFSSGELVSLRQTAVI